MARKRRGQKHAGSKIDTDAAPEGGTSDLLHEAKRLVASVSLPIQPQIVVDLNFELAMPDPDFGEITRLINSDPALAARTLKLANSPLYGTGKRVKDIRHAISLLGTTRLNDLIITSALQEAMAAEHDALNEQFWSHSLMVARTAELIAKQLLMVQDIASAAYLAGLFHDCATPIMRRRFSDYDSLVLPTLGQTLDAIVEEERRYATNHCVIGFLIARNWRLPKAVGDAVWFHHDPEVRMHKDPLVRTIKSLLLLAEYISLGDGTLGETVPPPDLWAEHYQQAVTELKITVDEITDLREDALVAFGSAV
jgi:putative nucleotidyltransferase with HDIG domain